MFPAITNWSEGSGVLARLAFAGFAGPKTLSREFPAKRVHGGTRLERKLTLAGTNSRSATISKWADGEKHKIQLARRPGTTADPNIVAVVATGGGLGASEGDIGFVPAPVADKLIAANAVDKVAVVVRRIDVNARCREASATVVVDVISVPAVRQAYGERVASEQEHG